MLHTPLTDSLVIRRASVADAQLLVSLSVDTFFETFAPINDAAHMQQYRDEEMNEQKLTAELADDNNFFFFASLGDTVIGYAKVRNAYTPAELQGHHCIELERLYLLKQYHDQKAGAALMQHCINHAHQYHYDTMWLGVWEHNERALRFYSKWGFTVFGSHIFRLGNDEQTDLLMKKNLG
jgi:ribosomal protein S18 acetylase RimI-like enzyme